MPTTRRRHAVTETPPVQEALDELRAERDERSERRRSLADRIRNRELPPVDLAVAEEVRRSGWARPL